jgi:Transcription elongation factor, GreA/GreB, C-term
MCDNTGIASCDTHPPLNCNTPVGRALLGRKAGDIVKAELPNGKISTIKILDVSDGPLLN